MFYNFLNFFLYIFLYHIGAFTILSTKHPGKWIFYGGISFTICYV